MASHCINSFRRLAPWRWALALFVVLATLLPAAVDAKGVPRAYAGIVVDAKSGKVLYQSEADATRYPASVSKVMTLYILFQELDSGRIKLSDKMPVSRHAAAAVPTKLGLKPGSTISVENAIKSMVTLSANDMARVVAEFISGSEDAFGKRMTATARALGMTHTTYVNASGLPDSRQVTTARDQATLGIAIYEHFPKYYAYFQTKSFTYGRRTYGNHNNLLGHNGIDGIKTGYTGAAGYNLLTAARTDGRHIVVVGFGFSSGAKRDAKVRDLVRTYLPKARSGSYLDVAMIPKPGSKGSSLPSDSVQTASASPVVPLPTPSFRYVSLTEAPANPEFGVGDVDTDVTVASLPPQPLERPVDLGIPPAIEAVDALVPRKRTKIDEIVGAFTDSYSLGAAPAPLGQTRPSAPLIPPVGIGEAGQPIDLMTSGSISSAASRPTPSTAAPLVIETAQADTPQAMPPSLDSGWVVQIGAAPTETGASTLLADAANKVGALQGFQSFVQRFDKDGQTYFRARFGGFDGQDAANTMCKQLKLAKLSCLAMQG